MSEIGINWPGLVCVLFKYMEFGIVPSLLVAINYILMVHYLIL